MRRTRFLSLSLLTLAVIAWCGIVLFIWDIQGLEQDRVQQMSDAQSSSDEQALDLQLHALAQNSASDRNALSTILDVDVVSAVDSIQSAGSAAGVDLKVLNVSPEGALATDVGQLPVQAIDFTVETDGAFSPLMRTAQLLETLPYPATLEALDLSESQNPNGPPTWHLQANIHVLTTANISS